MRWRAPCLRLLEPEIPSAAPESCSLSSRRLAEETAGTAPADLRYALLLEQARPWARECIDSLEEPVAARVRSLLGTRDDARLQLIHRPCDVATVPRIFLAHAVASSPALWEIPYAALLDPALTNLEALPAHGVRLMEPLYLVCVHGRRDVCCASRGVAFERALSEHVPERVYQTSHIGGHRFAATAVVYPEAFYYGRLEPGDASALARAHEAGDVGPTSKLRGRAGMEASLQAAEVFAMRHVGPTAPRELPFVAVGEGAYELKTPDGRHAFHVSRRELTEDSSKGCDDAPARLSTYVASF